MKVLGRWVTIGFAVLAVFLGDVVVVISGYAAAATHSSISDATGYAVAKLIAAAVGIATLMLASRRSGGPTSGWIFHAGGTLRLRLAVWMVFVEALGSVLGRKGQPWAREILLSARADGTLIW
jgi:hypothetical protein